MRNLIVGITCFLAIGAMTVNLAAAQQGKSKGGVSQKKGQSGGQKGQNGQKGKAGGQDRDPAKMAAKMVEQFDKNGDKALDVKELTAALESMRSQRGQRGQGANAKGKGRGSGKGGKGKGGSGKGGGKGKGQSA